MGFSRRLVVSRGRRPVTEAELQGVVTIGRHPQNTVALNDRTVSRWHAVIFLDPLGRSQLQDLGSSNGTLVQDRQVSRVRLQSGDCFRIGDFDCRYEEHGHAAAPGQDTQGTTTIGLSGEGGGRGQRFLGRSRPIEQLQQQIKKVAAVDCDVLLTGETGSGKGMAARLLHDFSRRAAGPFIAVNCAAIPAELEESEFFGHRRGAFTGAVADHRGAFEEANGGTLFLDEIGDMNLRTQAKILKAVEEKRVYRVGDSRRSPVELDIRIIAATHRDLEKAVRDKTFREDLYYRLARATLKVPALRERPDDVILLANHFLVTVGAEMPAAPGRSFSAGAREALLAHAWPGNVRELENVVRHALLWAAGAEIQAQDLGLGRRPGSEVAYTPGRPLADALADLERAYLEGALEHHGFNIARTARELKIGPNRLRDRMKRYGLGRAGPGGSDGD
jgi:DNA-binding NtrC family response regulator